jgi:hypothetical protein
VHSTSLLAHLIHHKLFRTETRNQTQKIEKMASNYDTQASTNYKEAFALFDKRGNSRVALESLGDLLRACGQNPTLAEIRELEKNVGSDCAFSLALSPTAPHSVLWTDLINQSSGSTPSVF